MLRTIFILLSILGLSQTVYANGTKDMYMGIGFLGGGGTVELTHGSSHDYSLSGLSGKVGFISETKNRFEISVLMLSESMNGLTENAQDTNTAVDFDWIATFNTKEDNSVVSPFLLAGLGAYHMTKTVSGTAYEFTTGSFNLGFGFYVRLDDELQLEFSVKQKLISLEGHEDLWASRSLIEDMTVSTFALIFSF